MQYKISAIAIGNGTAGRETETFIQTNFHLKMMQLSYRAIYAPQ